MVAAHNSLEKAHKRQRISEYDSCKKESVTIHNPASFNFQLATGPDTLVTSALKGKIQIKIVVVGTKHDWALGNRKHEGEYKK